MKCREIIDLLAAYAENQVSFEQTQLIERHLEHCIDCRAALLDYRTISEGLKSLRSTADLPDMAVINISDAKHVIKDKSFNRVRYALAAIPVIVIVIILAVLQPWVSSSSPQAVLAKAISAISNVNSFRAETSPSLIIQLGPDKQDVIDSKSEIEFVSPDRIHYKLTIRDHISEYFFIGDSMYYLIYNNITFIQPFLPVNIPNRENTLNELKSITKIQQLPDEVIGDVNCLHYKGIDKRNPDSTVELWISKSDYLLLQKIRRVENDENPRIVRYYDFNIPITIEAPVDSSGNLLPGWQKQIK
jgi:hypothetical protein